MKLMKSVFLLTCVQYLFFYPYSSLLKKKAQTKKKVTKQQKPLNLQPTPAFVVEEETKARKLGGREGAGVVGWFGSVRAGTD